MSTPHQKIIGIDPGTHHGAYAVWDDLSRVITNFGDIANDELLDWLRTQDASSIVCCETIQAYGQAVGSETFETCFFIGRVQEICHQRKHQFVPIKRKDVLLEHCCVQKGTDAQIRKAMLEYIGEPGTKKAPGPTYGIAGHIWSALAIATYLPVKRTNEEKIALLQKVKTL